jgi:hypothetical protein
MKLQTVASYNLYREAAETTNRENRKAREMARKQERRAKFFDGARFQAFQAARGGR